MRTLKIHFRSSLWAFPALFSAMLICSLALPGSALAQPVRTINAGTTIDVRTNEEIRASIGDGRIYSGTVDQDVFNRGGGVSIPRGSSVELLVKSISRDELALDLESVMVNGQRYGIRTEDSVISSPDAIGNNKRTGEYVGGGAAIGAIIGAIAGGGKGAAIGGTIGAAAGATTQIITHGKSVEVPPESLVTFRLERPLQIAADDRGFNHNGQHYHRGYGATPGDSDAYRDGLQSGRADSDSNRDRNGQNQRWTTDQDTRDYQSGYDRGYQRDSRNADRPGGGAGQPGATIRIGSDHNITWQGPPNTKVYVQVDNNPRQLFAAGPTGTQAASWITPGHLYVFVVLDGNGNEVARAQSDLRPKRNPR